MLSILMPCSADELELVNRVIYGKLTALTSVGITFEEACQKRVTLPASSFRSVVFDPACTAGKSRPFSHGMSADCSGKSEELFIVEASGWDQLIYAAQLSIEKNAVAFVPFGRKQRVSGPIDKVRSVAKDSVCLADLPKDAPLPAFFTGK